MAKSIIDLFRRGITSLTDAQAIAPPAEPGELCLEINELPADQRLLTEGAFQVFHADASQIPYVRWEIGRCREMANRGAGANSVRAIDLDEFDQHYAHLFVWDSHTQQLVGACRFAQTDRVVGEHGIEGLFTSERFNYSTKWLEGISPAIEVGRAFVRQHYPQSAASLLWKGLGQFISRHPRYKTVFAPLTLNFNGTSHAQEMMLRFLQANHHIMRVALGKAGGFARCATDLLTIAAAENVDAAAQVRNAILRQFLSLGGKFVWFDYRGADDAECEGILFADLTLCQPQILMKYMGDEGYTRFARQHVIVQEYDAASAA